MTSSASFQKALAAIDAFNAGDPRREEGIPYEQSYSEKLTGWVKKLKPDASEELLLAARGQHIGRWLSPREKYPEGRGGYLRWREDLKKMHAQKTAEIFKEAGYEDDFAVRVASIILKKDLREENTQTLEDALCLVFLETQFDDLKQQTPDEKMKEIVRKTWRKMSPLGQKTALALDFPAEARAFLESALAGG